MREAGQKPAGRIAVGGADGGQLLELDVSVGDARYPAVALVDSGASHCFVTEHVARKAGVTWDTSAQLFVRLADGEWRACLGVARNMRL